MDRWYEHPVYKGYYANFDGEVWSDKKNRKLKGYNERGHYIRVSLTYKYILLHIFVYECFNRIIVDTDKFDIDHIDEDKYNNKISNLQKLTRKQHAKKTNNRNNSKAAKSMSKTVIRYKIDENGDKYDVKEYISLTNAAKDMNGSIGNIWACIKNKQKISYGYKWKYGKQPDLPGEIWKTIDDKKFKGVQFSNKGRITTKTGLKTFGTTNKSGYYTIQINRNNYKVHRLICLAFLGPAPTEKHTVDHLDRNRGNNKIENLRWATQKEQMSNTGHCKSVSAFDLNGNIIGSWITISEAERETGVNGTSIRLCIIGERNSAGKYIWKLEKDNKTMCTNVKTNYPKAVIAYDKQGNEVGRWKTITEASKATNANKSKIGMCLKGERKTSGGYTWKLWK